KLGLPRSHVPRLTEWASEFLARVSHDNTRNRYSTSVKHLTNFFGAARLNEISPEVIDKFQRQRLHEGVRGATVNRDVSVLSAMLSRAVKWRYLPNNPCSQIDKLREADERREAKPFTHDEEDRLLKGCNPLLRIFVIVLIETG